MNAVPTQSGTENIEAASTSGEHRKSSERAPFGRRALFGAVASMVAAGAGKASARPSAPPTSSIGDPDPSALLTKLVRRATFGITPYELNLARAVGYDAYLDFHLNPMLIDDSVCDTRIATLPNLTKIYAEIYQSGMNQIVNELTEATIVRAIISKRQLFERLVEFWTDHFNIDVTKSNCAWLKLIDDRDVIRANALGNFSDLLAASATSGAMLVYLDNHISIAGNPNENYARELMELHTLGVDGGYTQQDVTEVARCLTGWQIYPDTFGYPLAGIFRYNGSQHDNGAKRVLGHVIPAGGGIQDGLTVLQILAEHPSTAKFVSRKMCTRFLGYTPSEALVRTVAGRFTATNGNITEVMRTILAPAHVAEAQPKFKRPFHAFVAGARAVNATVGSTSSFRTQLKIAGHLTFTWTSPDGFPDKIDFWSGLVLPRWNFGAQMMSGSLTGITTDAAAFFSGLTTADQMADRINANIFGGEMEQAERNRIRDYLLPNPPSAARKSEALGLAIGSPSFQWY